MNLFELATILNGQFSGNNAEFKTISTDSRAIKPGDCFVAIKGEFFDGHDFLHVVSEKKAAVAIVDRDVTIPIPTIRVKNTRQALIHLASFYREKVNIPVIAITGSCGKPRRVH
jgi:UDP-N-acetylmuramyl pentapeptide synthase